MSTAAPMAPIAALTTPESALARQIDMFEAVAKAAHFTFVFSTGRMLISENSKRTHFAAIQLDLLFL